MQAILALEDGRVFRGKGYGRKGRMSRRSSFLILLSTGYQEIFTDPSLRWAKSSFSPIRKSGNYGHKPGRQRVKPAPISRD